jgi:hypothetical protein
MRRANILQFTSGRKIARTAFCPDLPPHIPNQPKATFPLPFALPWPGDAPWLALGLLFSD